jgi:hypothetical protein
MAPNYSTYPTFFSIFIPPFSTNQIQVQDNDLISYISLATTKVELYCLKPKKNKYII